MTTGVERQAQALLHKADDYITMLQWEGAPDAPFGFHVQQAIEKSLKALLCQLRVEFKFTHDLEHLVLLLTAAGEQLPDSLSNLKEIGVYAVTHRYDDVPEFQVLDRVQALETVRTLRAFMLQRISALSAL